MARAGRLFKKLKAGRLDNSTEAEPRRLAASPPRRLAASPPRRLAAVSVLIIDDFALQPRSGGLRESAVTHGRVMHGPRRYI
jgi:hypothetical protein